MPDFFIVAQDLKSGQFVAIKMVEAYSVYGVAHYVPDVDFRQVGYPSMEMALDAVSEHADDPKAVLNTHAMVFPDLHAANNRGMCIISSWNGDMPIKGTDISLPDSTERLVEVKDLPELMKLPHRITAVAFNQDTGLFHGITWRRYADDGTKTSYRFEIVEGLSREGETLDHLKKIIASKVRECGQSHHRYHFIGDHFLPIESTKELGGITLNIKDNTKADPLVVSNMHVRFPSRMNGQFLPLEVLAYAKNIYDRMSDSDDNPSKPSTRQTVVRAKYRPDHYNFGSGR